MSDEKNATIRKVHNVHLRDDEKDFIDEAASASGMNRGSFMRHASILEAGKRLGYQLNEHLNGAKAA